MMMVRIGRNNDDGKRWSGLCERLRDLKREDGVHPQLRAQEDDR